MTNGEDTDEATQRLRTRRLVSGVAGALVARLLVLIVPLCTIPVMLDYLGPELFGLWMLASSLTSVFAFADLGLGNSILTLLPASLANGDLKRARSLIWSAYALLLGVCGLGLLLLCALLVLGAWPAFTHDSLGAEDMSPLTASGAMTIVLAGFVIMIPISFVQRLQYALQEALRSNIWQIGGALTTLILVVATVHADGGRLTVIAMSTFALPAILFTNTVLFFLRHRELLPTTRCVSGQAIGQVTRLGMGFVFLSIFSGVALNLDNLVVGTFGSLNDVAFFAIAVRLFSILSLAITFVALPLWPANSDALARGDIRWVRRTTTRMMLLSSIAVAGSGIMLAVIRDPLVGFWIGAEALIPLNLALALLAWSILLAVASPMFSVQNSQGLLRYQFVGWPIYLVLSLPAKVIGIELLSAAAVPAVGAAVYALVLVPTAWIGYRRTLSRVLNSDDQAKSPEALSKFGATRTANTEGIRRCNPAKM